MVLCFYHKALIKAEDITQFSELNLLLKHMLCQEIKTDKTTEYQTLRPLNKMITH